MRLTNLSQKPTLNELANEFIAVKKAQVRERTLHDYEVELRKFIDASSNDIDNLKEDTLKYFSSIPDTSPAIYNRPYSCLNAFFNWAENINHTLHNPLQQLGLHKRKDEGNIQPASIQSVKALLKACDKSTFTGLRNYTIITLMMDTGIRTCEIVRLKDTDFHEQDGYILISNETSKTHRQRILYLSSQVSNLITKLIDLKPSGFSDYIFPTRDGKQLNTNELAREFRKLCDKSGCKITPYQLRHSFATYACEQGMNLFVLQKLMGHTDLRTTKRYVDINQQKIIDEHSVYSPLNLMNNKRLIKT